MSSADVASWAGVAATVIAILVALFKDELKRLWFKPKLVASLRSGRLLCQKTPLRAIDQTTGGLIETTGYYLRMWVENKGNRRAVKVQVYASRLLRKQANGTFQDVDGYLPMNLGWTHAQKPDGRPEVFLDGLSPGMGQYCDIGHILDPKDRAKVGETLPGVAEDKTILGIALEVVPSTKSHLLDPGNYQLQIRLAAANSRPIDKTIDINLQGSWHENEERMLADGVGITLK